MRGILDQRALVLNRLWDPVTTTTVRTALTLLYRKAARVICTETYRVMGLDDWIARSALAPDDAPSVRTPRFRISRPEVILLGGYDGRPSRDVAFTRRNIYRRDGWQCQYCGVRRSSGELSIDHVVPRSRGGKTSWENCVLACLRCNSRKGNQTLRESGMRLMSVPAKPKWSPLSDVPENEPMPESWAKFVDGA